MGFGLIFIGYLTLAFLRAMPIGIFGCAMMISGLSKLEGYDERIKKAKNCAVLFLLYFVAFGAAWCVSTFGGKNVFDAKYVLFCDSLVYYTLFCVFNIKLTTALKVMCDMTGFEKGIKKSKTSLVMTLTFAFFAFLRLALSLFGKGDVLQAPLEMFEFVVVIYTSLFVYSCYMMIATQEIIDEEERKLSEYDKNHAMSFRTKKQTKKSPSSFSVKKKK